MAYVAIINIPGYLPESEPVAFDSAREAWDYLIDELERDELAWAPDDWNDTDGPASRTETALTMERNRDADKEGTVYGPSYLASPDEDTSTDLGLAYSVEEYDHATDSIEA